MKTEANDPAFAGNEYDHGQFNPGLSKREYFSALAMQGFISAWGGHDLTDREDIAHDAVLFADALIKELNNTSTKN